MLGLMYVGAAALYLTLVLLVARWAWRAVRRAGGSAWRASAAALPGVLLMYLLVFWNLIPAAMTHRSACKRDAGFQVFVEPAAWIDSHRDRLDRMKGVDPEKVLSGTRSTFDGVSKYAYMGGLLLKEERHTGEHVFGIGLGRLEVRIVDAQTQQLLARAVDYGLGSREDARIWLSRSSCFPEAARPLTQLFDFNQQLKSALK